MYRHAIAQSTLFTAELATKSAHHGGLAVPPLPSATQGAAQTVTYAARRSSNTTGAVWLSPERCVVSAAVAVMAHGDMATWHAWAL